MSISKGKFISFEGIDACGKSTQVKLLLNIMNKNTTNTVLVREPGGSTISEEIRQILLNDNLEDMSFRTEALLMAGSRAQLSWPRRSPQYPNLGEYPQCCPGLTNSPKLLVGLASFCGDHLALCVSHQFCRRRPTGHHRPNNAGLR